MKQSQKAGSDSNQIQIGNLELNVGIDEKRAREIYKEMNVHAIEEYTAEALKVSNLRISEFENALLPKMEAIDGALEVFADPAFQLLLIDAQRSAASSGRKADYELLTELLIHRFNIQDNRACMTAVNRAVKIVHEISDRALLGLTAIYCVSSFLPSSGNIYIGLDYLDTFFDKILYDELPTGLDWIDELDILNVVRIDTTRKFLDLEELYTKHLCGYIDVGIEKNSKSHQEAIRILSSNNLDPRLLITHVLNSDYVRLDIINEIDIIKKPIFKFIQVDDEFVIEPVQVSYKQQESLKSVYALYSKNESLKQENVRMFISELDKRSNIKRVKDWWNNIEYKLHITSIGKALAKSNVQRCDDKIFTSTIDVTR